MTESINLVLLRSLGKSYLLGPVELGSALDQTGTLNFYSSLSALVTGFQAGNTTSALTYTLPVAGPTTSGQALTGTTAGVMSWATYPSLASAFVTIGSDATLTGERSLTGTANQVVVTDNGANSTVVLSLANPLTLPGALSLNSNKITSLANGTASSDAAAFGQIQVLKIVTATSTTAFSTTSSTYQTTNCSASITPTSASNRVLIMATGCSSAQAGGDGAFISLFRDTTNLGGGSDNAFLRCNSAVPIGQSLDFVDSPATTSAITYAVKICNDDNTRTVSFNTAQKTSITLIEVV